MSERAYLRIGYFVRLIAVVNRVGLALRPRQRAIKLVTRALFLILRVADASPSWPVSSLIKLLVKSLLYLVDKSRADADAEFAMALLKEVHGGRDLCGPMFKSRIVEQMCREPDEESSFYSDLVRGDMRVMIYNLPGGSRLRFIMLPSSDAIVGWKISRQARREDVHVDCAGAEADSVG